MFGSNVKCAKKTVKEELVVASRSIAMKFVYKETNQAVSRIFCYSSAFLSIIYSRSTFSLRRVASKRAGHVPSNLRRWTLHKLEA